MFDRTIRLRLSGRGAISVTRNVVLDYFTLYNYKDIVGLYKAEDPFEWFVCFQTDHSVERAKQNTFIQLTSSVEATVASANEVIQTVRFSWVPVYVNDELFKDYLELHKFKVISCKTQFDRDDGVYNGTRSFLVRGAKDSFKILPHIIDFHHYHFQSLVIVPGRPPLCLKCKGYGHLRSFCPQNRPRPQQDNVQIIQNRGNSPWQGTASNNQALASTSKVTPGTSDPIVSKNPYDVLTSDDDEQSRSSDDDDEQNKTIVDNNKDNGNEEELGEGDRDPNLASNALEGATAQAQEVETGISQESNSQVNVNDNDKLTNDSDKEEIEKKQSDSDIEIESDKDSNSQVVMNDEGDICPTQRCNLSAKRKKKSRALRSSMTPKEK